MTWLITTVIIGFIAYNTWRITDQLPDLIFRLSEIQRDLAEIRRGIDRASDDTGAASGSGDDD